MAILAKICWSQGQQAGRKTLPQHLGAKELRILAGDAHGFQAAIFLGYRSSVTVNMRLLPSSCTRVE